jgi:hypothetical protein
VRLNARSGAGKVCALSALCALSPGASRVNPELRYWATTVTETGMEFGGLQAFASQA